MSFNPGDTIYKFKLLKKLGGTFGEVWHARDNTLDKDVALKILDSSFEPIAKQLDEARIGNRFNHKNLLQIHYADVCFLNGSTYTLISQEYLAKGAITGHLNTRNFLPVPKTVKLIREVLLGLEYLHNSGFYHNDIKPGNILLDDQGNGVLADYGIAGFSPTISPVTPKNAYKVHRAPETSTVTPIIGIQSDIYQVGCTAYRLLNGISTLASDFHALGEAEYIKLQAAGKIPNRKNYEPYVPSNLRAIINKALDPTPTSRFNSALDMRRKLERLPSAGYWTADNSGALIGVCSRNEYRFEIQYGPGGVHRLIAIKRNLASGKTTKISKFCIATKTVQELDQMKAKFIAWVIENGS